MSSGEYVVYVKDNLGCGIIKETISILMYPYFFTPNGDGYNDSWQIFQGHSEPSLEVLIFDRYGKLLKTFFGNSIGWDGTSNGVLLPSSDYWFIVKRENGKIHKGHFTLKR
ncbi:T9SS type B sorting domain-containing protein [Flavobacterium piscinae]|uniref:T9SS type B sorting domain-containing protein n=1 Tax=Flavobacterium piscinae TaxID=2506424 RepID=UPI0019BBDE82|nr:T9SS type B sorting domain-containing protein [Flavobacterium piscinae]MBC8883854.1 T9SS type B sorting domain-containing protein [Flavobacterium piscinae]